MVKQTDKRIVGSTGSTLPESNLGKWGTNLPSEARQNESQFWGDKWIRSMIRYFSFWGIPIQYWGY